MREIARGVGLTERGVSNIVRSLEEDSLLSRSRDGRKTRFLVNCNAVMKHLAAEPLPLTLEEIASLAQRIANEGAH